MDYRNTTVERRGAALWLTMSRPQVLNALNPEMISEMLAAVEEAQSDKEVKLLVVRGGGRAFCVGADLKVFGKEGGYQLGSLPPLLEALQRLDKPVIAGVHGYAIAGGLYLACACDMIVATQDTVFQDTHARWGVITRGGEAQMLMRLIGPLKAKQVIFTGDRFGADEAKQMGLVYRVAPQGKLDETVGELADKLLGQSQSSLRAFKILLNEGMRATWAAADRLESVMAPTFVSEDGEERMKAFQKRRGTPDL